MKKTLLPALLIISMCISMIPSIGFADEGSINESTEITETQVKAVDTNNEASSKEAESAKIAKLTNIKSTMPIKAQIDVSGIDSANHKINVTLKKPYVQTIVKTMGLMITFVTEPAGSKVELSYIPTGKDKMTTVSSANGKFALKDFLSRDYEEFPKELTIKVTPPEGEEYKAYEPTTYMATFNQEFDARLIQFRTINGNKAFINIINANTNIDLYDFEMSQAYKQDTCSFNMYFADNGIKYVDIGKVTKKQALDDNGNPIEKDEYERLLSYTGSDLAVQMEQNGLQLGTEPIKLAVGENIIKFDIEHKNGDKRTYTVKATREADSECSLKTYKFENAVLDKGIAYDENIVGHTKSGQMPVFYAEGSDNVVVTYDLPATAENKANHGQEVAEKTITMEKGLQLDTPTYERTGIADYYGRKKMVPTTKDIYLTYTNPSDGSETVATKKIMVYAVMPDGADRVYQMLSAPGQYTSPRSYGATADTTLRADINTDNLYNIVSLGGFGGFITYQFDNPIINNINNKYGIDFVIYGNSFGALEPAAVSVAMDKDKDGKPDKDSEGNEIWYNIAGSEHYENSTDWNYYVTYNRNATKINRATTSESSTGLIENIALDKYYYPLESFYKQFGIDSIGEKLKLDGVCIYENGKAKLSVCPFGYVDVGKNGEVVPTAIDVSNPYKENNLNYGGTPIDLSWAVDGDGIPVNVEEISFVKVTNACNAMLTGFGELSTEVGGISKVNATVMEDAVGVTAEPTSIKINGKEYADADYTEVEGVNAKYINIDLDDKSLASVNVIVNGVKTDNIYVNNQRYEGNANYVGLLKEDGSRMVRVIVQNADKEPLIYVYKITGGGNPAINADLESITLTPGDQTIKSSNTNDNTYTFNVGNSVEKVALQINALNPEAKIKFNDEEVIANEKTKAFNVNEGQNQYDIAVTSTDKSNIQHYKVIINRDLKQEKPENKINVEFMFTGDTFHYDDSKEQYIGEHNKQTWIERTTVTIPKESTVKYLTDMMLYNAGIEFDNTDGTYIAKVMHPSEKKWLGEFDNGPNSGWMYRHNGKIADVGYASRVLKNNDTVLWFYTDDYTKETGYEGGWDPSTGGSSSGGSSGGGSSSGSGGSSASTTTPTTNSKKEVSVNATVSGNTATATIKVSEAKNAKEITIKSAIADITFNQKATEAIVGKKADLKFEVKKLENSSLTTEQQAKVGTGTVLDINLKAGNESVTNFSGGKATVTVPYTLKSGEKAEGMVVYYLADNGKAEVVDGHYDASKKVMVFETSHFSKYVVSYDEKVAEAKAKEKVNFSDVKANDWFKESVNALAAKGILTGKTETTFAPQDKITRAEFVAVLARMSGQEMPSGKTTFSDVAESSWYAKYVAWAVNAGIAKGTSETAFAPNANITRQDMAVMITRYAQYMKKDVTGINEATKFADESQIASYAKDAVTSMQKAGIINGVKATDGSYSFMPKNNATRAEAAKMIYQMVK